MYWFLFVCDDSTTVLVNAKDRSEAIEFYCREKGCSIDYVKAHCVIRKTVKKMVTCKDCIHACVCPLADGAEYRDIDMIREDCEYFVPSDNEGVWIETRREWDFSPYYYDDYTCSVCGKREQDKSPYCRWCGTKMKGEKTK
jgi:hypothetical protein